MTSASACLRVLVPCLCVEEEALWGAVTAQLTRHQLFSAGASGAGQAVQMRAPPPTADFRAPGREPWPEDTPVGFQLFPCSADTHTALAGR